MFSWIDGHIIVWAVAAWAISYVTVSLINARRSR